jgi:hypothetical protein
VNRAIKLHDLIYTYVFKKKRMSKKEWIIQLKWIDVIYLIIHLLCVQTRLVIINISIIKEPRHSVTKKTLLYDITFNVR